MEVHVGCVPTCAHFPWKCSAGWTLQSRTLLGGPRLSTRALPNCRHAREPSPGSQEAGLVQRSHGCPGNPRQKCGNPVLKTGFEAIQFLGTVPWSNAETASLFSLWWYLLRLLFQKQHCCGRDTLFMKSWARKKDQSSTQNSHGISV